MRILVSGLCGRMGREVARLAARGFCGAVLAGGVDAHGTGRPGARGEQKEESAGEIGNDGAEGRAGCQAGCQAECRAEGWTERRTARPLDRPVMHDGTGKEAFLKLTGIAQAVPCFPTFSSVQVTVDCVVDFSHHENTAPLLEYTITRRLPLVLATTGQTPEEQRAIGQAATRIPIFYSANCSLGVALLIRMARQVAAVMPEAEIEVVEAHHDRKLDAPSGTALAIADAIREVRPKADVISGRCGYGRRSPEEIGVHSIRLGSTVGEHTVLIGTQNETLVLRHEAKNRSLYAEGALEAAAFLCGLPAGRCGVYGMEDLIRG